MYDGLTPKFFPLRTADMIVMIIVFLVIPVVLAVRAGRFVDGLKKELDKRDVLHVDSEI